MTLENHESITYKSLKDFFDKQEHTIIPPEQLEDLQNEIEDLKETEKILTEKLENIIEENQVLDQEKTKFETQHEEIKCQFLKLSTSITTNKGHRKINEIADIKRKLFLFLM